MNKALLVMAIITIGLFAYAVKTAQIPPASVDYREVFYLDNQSSVFVEKDGWGLFEMDIKPKISNFELRIEFPENTSYLIEYNGKEYQGSGTFKMNINEEGTLYVHFKVSQDLVKSLYYENGRSELKIKLEKPPFWRDSYVIYLVPRKSND